MVQSDLEPFGFTHSIHGLFGHRLHNASLDRLPHLMTAVEREQFDQLMVHTKLIDSGDRQTHVALIADNREQLPPLGSIFGVECLNGE